MAEKKSVGQKEDQKNELFCEEWRRKHPEDTGLYAAEENYFFSPIPSGEAAVEQYRKRIKALWEELSSKRERYVANRDLQAAALSEEVKKEFCSFVEKEYNSSNQAIAAVIGLLLIEGLRYPDKELNAFSFDFLQKKQDAENAISWSLWVNLWDTDFVPLDAVRLMLIIEDGSFKPRELFKPLVEVVSSKILRHLEQENRRLEWAQGLEDINVRRKECGRKSRRIFFFQALLCAYKVNF